MSETMEVRKVLDYLPGDLVQMVTRDYPGALGTIIGTQLSKDGSFLLYQVLINMSEKECRIVLAVPEDIRFLSHAEE